jgi:serine-type D-Ala-D-Ala carboxypeptidase (penicillin-binding protein 5/6)
MVLGAALAAGIVVAMQVPLLDQSATTRVHLGALALDRPSAPPIQWPTQGTAAVLIPSLHVAVAHHDVVVPIASLAKMMTAYVTLREHPLALGQSGPCLVVNAADVATYVYMNHDGQSSVAVAEGETLCEIDLLQGLLVHSANNFAVLLATMVAGSQAAFVARMNEMARHLGLVHTHYVEPSGYDPGSVSTALEQARLAALLMASPLVRAIVSQTSVTLPVAGTVDSFTPYVGVDGVIGVKSGRTDAAGGCDVMAMTFTQGSATKVLYAVVLGQRGGDLLGPAGDAALELATSARDNQVEQTISHATSVATIGWGARRTDVVPARTHRFYRWAASNELPVRVHLRHFTHAIRRGQVVGWMDVVATTTTRIELVARTGAAPPTLWQRLR